jgi:hypothetical protein
VERVEALTRDELREYVSTVVADRGMGERDEGRPWEGGRPGARAQIPP